MAARRNARIAAAAIKRTSNQQPKQKKTSDKLVDLIKPISNAESLSKSYSVDDMDAMVAAFGMPHSTSLEDITRAVESNLHLTKTKASSPSSSSPTISSLQQHQHPPPRRLMDSIAMPGSGSSSYNNLVDLAGS